MLKLHGKLKVLNTTSSAPYLATVTLDPCRFSNSNLVLIGTTGLHVGAGVRAILETEQLARVGPPNIDVYRMSSDFSYLGEGDIIRLDPISGAIRTLYRRASPHNTILLTERCNHYCLMCSQPPKRIDDSALLLEARELIELIPQETTNLGFSGGEPTLYGDGLISLLRHTKEYLPKTSVDLLSNGRAFKDGAFTRKYAAIGHPALTVGIPIYSDDPVNHDFVVQSKGAFDDTIEGVLNLKKHRQRVEVRVVIHKQTIDRLLNLCEFICRNLRFVDHVALMGLEITGFTRANLDMLWIDPYEYRDILSEAVLILNSYGMDCSVYNHQLCTVNPDVLGNYRKSISDWKNEYLEECTACKKLNDCGGLFSSSKMFKHSSHIRAFT